MVERSTGSQELSKRVEGHSPLPTEEAANDEAEKLAKRWIDDRKGPHAD
jgi:hypothetical protein